MMQKSNNSDISHFSDTVYYDSELRELSKLFKDSYDIFKRIQKRASRCQTLQISKSLFDYVQMTESKCSVPQQFYDFKSDDVRICVYRYKGSYSVLVYGFDYLKDDFRCSLGASSLYGEFVHLSDCVNFFLRVIAYYINNILRFNDLFCEIPF